MHIPHYNVVSHPILSVICRGFSELFALEKTIRRISELSRSFKGSYTKKQEQISVQTTAFTNCCLVKDNCLGAAAAASVLACVSVFKDCL